MSVACTRTAIVQERVMPAPPDEVFAAWSDAASLREWMCPDPHGWADVELDFRVGGRFRIVMHGADRSYAHHGEYVVIEPPRRLVLTWVSEWATAAARRTRIEVTFAPTAEGRETILRLTHDQLPAADTYATHAAGWGAVLDKLVRRMHGTSGARSRRDP